MYIFLEIFLKEDLLEINNSLIEAMHGCLNCGGCDMSEKIKSFKAYKKRKKNKNKRGIFKRKSGILVLVLIVAFGIGDLCIYQISSSLKYDIYYLEKDLKEKQNKLQTLEVEKRVNQNSNKIEKDAIKKLNMIYPTEYQKKYISVDD